jgi:hypothetical protein
MKIVSRLRWIWLLLLLPAVAVWPALTRPIATLAYDAGTAHLYRSIAYSQAVSDGVLFPRWEQFLHWGLGSPLFTFHPPLVYAMLDLLFRVGIAHPIGWRVLIAGGLVVAFLGTYLLVCALTGRRWPAVLAATMYLYAPYVLRNALERGSIESFSMFLYPWVLWALLWAARKPGVGRLSVATLLWTTCICTHVLGPLMLALFAAVLALAVVWRYRTLLPVIALMAGLFLTAPVWAPAFAEQTYIHIERDFGQGYASPAANPLPLDRLLTPPEIFDVMRDNNGMGDQVGLLQMLMLVVGLLSAAYAWIRQRRKAALALGATTLAGLILFWLLTATSDPVWRLLASGLERLQYRSRLMGLQALFAAVASGLFLVLWPKNWQRSIALVISCLAVLVMMPALYVELHHRYGDFESTLSLAQVRAAEIRSGGTAFTSFGEFTPRWRTDPFDQKLAQELGPDFDAGQRPLANPPAIVKLLATKVRTGAWDLELAASEPATLTLRLLYYPRWVARVDGQAAVLSPEAGTGYTQVRLPAGTHRVSLRYGSTNVERGSLAVSGLTAAGLLALWVRTLWRARSSNRLGCSPKPCRSGWGRSVSSEATKVVTTEAVSDVSPESTPPIWLLGVLTALLVFKFAYVDPATTWLRCVSTATYVCGAQAATDVRFAAAPGLRGYAVAAEDVRPADELRITLFWQGAPGVTARLSSFVHVRNSQSDGPMNPRTQNEIWAQAEHLAPGGLLTTEFLPGKLYKDEFRVCIPADMPPGEYFLEIGWFDPATGEQLDPLADAVRPPLRVLWRSILLPSITVSG